MRHAPEGAMLSSDRRRDGVREPEGQFERSGGLRVHDRRKMGWAGCVVAAALFHLAAAPGAAAGDAEQQSAADNLGQGYLLAPSLSPLHILRPSPLFAGQARGPRGTWEAGMDAQWANIWNYDANDYLIDGEWYRMNARLAYALRDSVTIGVDVPAIGREGGFADRYIEEFHQKFGFDSQKRDQFPRDQLLVQTFDEDGDGATLSDESWGLGDVSGFLIWQAARGGRRAPAVAILAQVTAPTGDADALEGLGEPSAAVGAVASKRIGGSPFLLHGGLGFFYCPADELAGIELNEEEFSALLGIESQFTPRASLLVQNLSTTGAAESFPSFSDPCHEISVGMRWRAGAATTVEASAGENIGVYDNSADVGFHFLVSRKF